MFDLIGRNHADVTRVPGAAGLRQPRIGQLRGQVTVDGMMQCATSRVDRARCSPAVC